MIHYADKYLLSPTHPVTVGLVGCGGTGSQVLTCLARMDFALRGLGHPGFHVTAYDPDEITKANLGRQLFSPVELGLNKAVALITRINRFFGLGWYGRPFDYSYESVQAEAAELTNIVITCVDTIKARMDIADIWHDITSQARRHGEYDNGSYWLDFGNTQHTGQAVLGSFDMIRQPDDTYQALPLVTDVFELSDDEEDHGPSCSLAEALNRQDLFINTTLATLGMDILWKLFRETKIEHHGVFVNLKTMKVNPIPVPEKNHEV